MRHEPIATITPDLNGSPYHVSQVEYAHLVGDIREHVHRRVPAGWTVLVVSRGDERLVTFDRRTGWHFPREASGKYRGYYPRESGDAVRDLEEARALGADVLVIPATSLWWLDHYADFARRLHDSCTPLELGPSCAAFAISARARALETEPSDAEASETAPSPGEDELDTCSGSDVIGELFDPQYYADTNEDLRAAGVATLEHFLTAGWREGRRPNRMFDPLWYAARHPESTVDGWNPLVHYAVRGEAEGNAPSLLFDPTWYAEQVSEAVEPGDRLRHYLRSPYARRTSTIPAFDPQYYLEHNPDVAAAGVDPLEHFLGAGFMEGRNPSADFDVSYYTRRYLGGDRSRNPLLHYLEHRHLPGYVGRAPVAEVTIPREVKRFTSPGPDFEAHRPLPDAAQASAKMFAFYLPQFHAIPENDAWWGNGFTEWTNIMRALPRFHGHYQPRVPRDLGFYQLDSAAAIARQAALARSSGLAGFFFYYYTFNDKRLLERPVELLLQNPDIDCEFALVWANENWTRRWDGGDSEILISQDYLIEHESALIADFARHFADSRYLRLDGRPLLALYRPGIIPDAKSAIARWRRLFEDEHGERPILIMVQGFGESDPTVFGLDGAVELPPHKLAQDLADRRQELDVLDPDFSALVIDYDDLVRASLSEPPADFPLIKTVVPGWDNDARRQGQGMLLHGSTPRKYESWLDGLLTRARAHRFHGEAIVCVNAWNEWAEAAYLEPDVHYGSAYLNATGRALTGRRRPAMRTLLVGHDAHPHGAQMILLNLGRELQRQHGVAVEFLLLGGGGLRSDFEEVAPTAILGDDASLRQTLAERKEGGADIAIVNSLASAHCVAVAEEVGMATTLLVHELPGVAQHMNLTGPGLDALTKARRVVFPSDYVRSTVLETLAIPDDERFATRPQGLYRTLRPSAPVRRRVRQRLGIPTNGKLVIGAGYADLRKGFDLFLHIWRAAHREHPDLHFAWVGDVDSSLRVWLGPELEDAEKTGTFHLIGFTESVGDYYSAADLFALTSREDPLPSVALEAMSIGLPVVAFDDTGGIPEVVRKFDAGAVVPRGSVWAFATAIDDLLARGSVPSTQTARFRRAFDNRAYARDILSLASPDAAAVSVVVPNYNYGRHLRDRLASIFSQDLPVREVIVLDDASTDDSIEVVEKLAHAWDRTVRVVRNRQNSGSVFHQWAKGAKLASGEFLWLAEADDRSAPSFLRRAVEQLRSSEEIAFVFCDSDAVDSEDLRVSDSYKPYYATVDATLLAADRVFEGEDFVQRLLSVKNLILNVSAVVWRRQALVSALGRCDDELGDFKVAGDWRLYLETLSTPGSKVAYVSEPLNTHRRHANSVTHSLDSQRHLDEIERLQLLAAARFELSPDVKRKQRQYLAELGAQFGLTSPAAPSSDHSTAAAATRSGPGDLVSGGRRP